MNEGDEMAILVTGGAGYIGSHTVVELLNANYQVIVVDNLSNSSIEVIKRVKQLTGKDFVFYQEDILKIKGMNEIFNNHDIEAVIHFAAFKAVGESVEQPLKYYQNNINGSIQLARVMEENDVKRIVYSSSATVYGVENPSPLDESMPIGNATNPYGYSKIVTEQMLKDLAYADQEWGVTLLRYFNPIGAHESGQLGESPQGVPNNLMPYITQVAVGRREELTIHGDDYDTSDGTGVRDYIHVVDLAKGHVLALDKLLQDASVSIYNLGTGEGYSVLDLINAFQEATGQEIAYKVGPRRAGDIATVYANPRLAQEHLGWVAQKSILDMCKDSWRWQSMNPRGYEVDA